MIRFTVRLLLKNKVLWAWPIITLLFALGVGYYTDIQAAGNSYSFLVTLSDGNSFASAFLLNGLFGFIILIAVIGLPTHFSKNMEPERASLILSKPTTRTEFYLSEFAGVLIVSLLYTLVTILIFAGLILFEAGYFPIHLYLAMLLYIPLYIMAIYTSIALLLILTQSYLASVLLAYLIVAPFSGFLYNAEMFLSAIGWDSGLILSVTNGLSYLIPSTAGIDRLMFGFANQAAMQGGEGTAMPQMIHGVFSGGFTVFDWQLFMFILISCLPFFLLGLFLLRRKQF